MPNGFWTLVIDNTDPDNEIELTDFDREHIAELIVNGYTSGVIIQGE